MCGVCSGGHSACNLSVQGWCSCCAWVVQAGGMVMVTVCMTSVCEGSTVVLHMYGCAVMRCMGHAITVHAYSTVVWCMYDTVLVHTYSALLGCAGHMLLGCASPAVSVCAYSTVVGCTSDIIAVHAPLGSTGHRTHGHSVHDLQVR